MAQKEVVVRISAQDAASPVFRRLATEAQAMGSTIETTSDRSSMSLDRVSKAGLAFGAVLGTATLAMGEFSRAAAEDEASQARVEQAIANTGKAIDDYTGKLDAAIKKGQEKAFSDDETREALTRLIGVTGDADASINELGLVMDFARARGIDLASSADIVGKVMGGNLGILSRYGIVLDEGATATEALALIQKRSAGQAETYAQTQVGQLDIFKDKIDETTEALGAHAGELQTILLLLPQLKSGYVALAGALGGLGAGPVLAGIAALSAAAYYGYSLNQQGSGTENATAGLLAKAAGLGNKFLPGDPFSGIQSQFQGIVDANNLGKVTNAVIYPNPYGMGGLNADEQVVMNLKSAGVLPYNFSGNIKDAAAYINTRASATGTSTFQYIQGHVNPSYVYDSISGSYVDPHYYQTLQAGRYFDLGGQTGSGATTMNYGALGSMSAPSTATPRYYGDIGSTAYNGPYQPAATTPYGGATGTPTYIGPAGQTSGPFSGSGVSGLTSGGVDVSGGLATSIADAIKKQSDAYYGLADASEVAQRGLSQFKAVQDSILGQQGIYTDQLSEFTQEVNLQQDAYDILNKRREEGQKLTKSDIEFLDNFAEANERGTGAQEDATVAAGKLAQAYLLNMEIGDQLNQSVGDTTGAVGDLVDIIEDLILSMENVPPSVRTRIELERAEEAGAALSTIVGLLNALDGRTTTFYVNVEGNGVSLGRPNGVGPTADLAMNGITAYANGGTAYDPLMPRFANGGTYALVGEVGPELVKLSRGDQVTPTGASRSMMRRGGDQFHFNAPVTVVAPDPQAFANAAREQSVGSSRI